ncbi:excinuclease ABC subunit C [Candidatus Berkelbacteria bacterium CG10_big_fil_rev_8_21_14_0_10_43_13]|uniref:Excinuclease ABC subunit C n=1 Tax=Candidatus Berkelbacteria bacterium CG10_big_fil_rev_8_21_14_0_10_43_13 TaxID=1974514 RepID=A0A2H0W5X9_9BACT|nr:MAG: excinuclease ABC subunit C [Candidatus Berkelbacteria bacterium CG10_big_fil_rev_8_21_14_0_10_43_13]
MIYTYLIKSEKDNNFYTGITEDPEKRLHEHNCGKLKTTSQKRPWKLVYFKEHTNYLEARKHEIWLKKKNRKYKEFLAQLAPPEPKAG